MPVIYRQMDIAVVFVNREGQEVREGSDGAIELRCTSPGWRWHDQEGRRWGSAGAPIKGELLPRWVCITGSPSDPGGETP